MEERTEVHIEGDEGEGAGEVGNQGTRQPFNVNSEANSTKRVPERAAPFSTQAYQFLPKKRMGLYIPFYLKTGEIID